MTAIDLRSYISAVPNFPKEGILFRDITPLLAHHEALAHAIDLMAAEWEDQVLDSIVALDARGFIFGSLLAQKLKKPLVLVRKKGKLPGATISHAYGLEYGKDVLEIQTRVIKKHDYVLIVDDLLASGGTAGAAGTLIENSGGIVVGCQFLIDLVGLPGRKFLEEEKGYAVKALLEYGNE